MSTPRTNFEVNIRQKEAEITKKQMEITKIVNEIVENESGNGLYLQYDQSLLEKGILEPLNERLKKIKELLLLKNDDSVFLEYSKLIENYCTELIGIGDKLELKRVSAALDKMKQRFSLTRVYTPYNPQLRINDVSIVQANFEKNLMLNSIYVEQSIISKHIQSKKDEEEKEKVDLHSLLLYLQAILDDEIRDRKDNKHYSYNRLDFIKEEFKNLKARSDLEINMKNLVGKICDLNESDNDIWKAVNEYVNCIKNGETTKKILITDIQKEKIARIRKSLDIKRPLFDK